MALKKVNIHEAKTQFSKLIQRVAAGDEITIANRGVPVARLVPAAKPKPYRELGIDRAIVTISDDFDAPLPEEILQAFESGSKRPKNRKR